MLCVVCVVRRAIKPNMEKVPNKFQGTLSLQQLRYAGVFEAVKIRQTGYPFRYPHLEFLQRFVAPLSADGPRPHAIMTSSTARHHTAARTSHTPHSPHARPHLAHT
jgi:hypothetical protein